MNMSRPSSKKFWLIPAAVFLSVLMVIGILCLSYFHINRTLEVKRLRDVASLSGGMIKKHLLQNQLVDLEKKLEVFSQQHSIDALELYGRDGTILTAYGGEGDTLPDSIFLGEDTSYRWPLTFRFQHSQIYLHNEKPLGFLILYSSMNDDMLLWVVCGIAAVLIMSTLFVGLLLSRKKSENQSVLREKMTMGIEDGSHHSPPPKALLEKARDAAFPDSSQGVKREVSYEMNALRRERDKALASAKAKGDFLANMSHEIRTSMNGVMGIISLLQNSGIDGERRRLLDAAARSADSLLLIINDSLDFSKIESGKINFERIPFDLRQVIEESITLYIDTARVKNVGLHCYIPLEISTNVFGDPTRLRQIITNLLSNAVKFTEEGEVSLRVALVERAGKSQRLLVSVEDTGIGIAPEKLGNIFDMFNQADMSTTRKYGGTGLGLTVCKQLVELQDGVVGVKSKLGKGTSFWFTLDFEVEQGGEAGLTVPRELVDKKIVLFDNCETCSTIISQYLREASMVSTGGESVQDILSQLGKMVVDGYLPDSLIVNSTAVGGDLDSLLKGVLQLYPEKTPELFLLSRRDSEEKKFNREGVSGIIHKPVRLQQLIEEVTGQQRKISDKSDLEDLEKLHGSVLLVDDEQINQHVGKIILSKLGLSVDVAHDGSQAILKTKEKHYDLVLMDLQMPDLNGIEATEAIRQREKVEGVQRHTIIAVTANVLSSIKQQCLDVGMDDFISKPIKPDELRQNLRPWLSDDSSQPVAEEGDPSATENDDAGGAAGDDLVIWNRKLALEYVGGDGDLLTDLMKLFLVRKNSLIDDIEEALATGESEAVSCAAHAFKGAVNHFAAQRCQQLALSLEKRASEGWYEGIEASVTELKLAADLLVKELRQQV